MHRRVTIAEHEREAMWKLILNARALGGMLGGDHAAKLKVWAQAVEDVLARMEGDDDANVEAGQRQHQGS